MLCVQGNCSGAPPATFRGIAPVEPLKPRQCVVSARGSGFRIFTQKLWIDNVLLAWDVPSAPAALEEPPGLAVMDVNTATETGQPDSRAVYMTNSTFQGPSEPEIRPLRLWQASAILLQGTPALAATAATAATAPLATSWEHARP